MVFRLTPPTRWPRPATPCDLIPIWAGEFRDFNDWVNHATHRLAGCSSEIGTVVGAIGGDTLGRRCSIGHDFQRARDEDDFQRARDEDAFPVRYFFECHSPSAEAIAPQLDEVPADG